MKKHFLSFIVCIVLFASCDTNEPTNKKDNGIGKFSVSESKQVTFSPGNLQYTQSTNTWSFAENQWDYISTNNVIGGSVSSVISGAYVGTALADKVDLFGWSTSANNFGVSTSTDYDDYSGAFVDWGTNQIGADVPNTWRTLTAAEWRYLCHTRTNADNLRGIAQINGVNGLILLSDDWTCPVDVTFKSSVHSVDLSTGAEGYAAHQTFTANQWSKLEAAGAVFLPAAGSRTGLLHHIHCGHYWSASKEYSEYAWYLYLDRDNLYTNGEDRYHGYSVRLVKDL